MSAEEEQAAEHQRVVGALLVGHIRDASAVGRSIRKKCPPSIIVSIAILSAVAGAIMGATLT